MTDKKEDPESDANQIKGIFRDNASNIVIGSNNIQLNITMPDGSSKLIGRDDLSLEAQELLKASDGEKLIEVGTEQETFLFIQTKHGRFSDTNYRTALKRLCEHKLAAVDPSQEVKHHKYYNLTYAGEQLAQGLQVEE